MINPDQKLNPNMFDKNTELKSTRAGFGEGLLLAGEKSNDVVVLCADVTESTYTHLFREKFPERFFEMGIAEQNMASVASGMSAMGKIPVMASYAVFSPGRNWEQIRTTICYNDRPVIIVGSHAGVTVGPDGGSHQALEDIALMRVLPRITVVSPCDAIEAKKAILNSIEYGKSVYIRLSREKTPIITTEETPFEIGKTGLYFGKEKGKADLGIVATGPSLYKVLKVAEVLRKEGLDIKVLNISTIKPLDKSAIVSLAEETGGIVTVEDHQIAGGLGSAVAECLVQNYPIPIGFIGVRDKFGQSGKPEELLKYYEMDEEHILKMAKKVLARK